ncbi:hypothetical protein BV25DRAFT_1811872 [Artomyces pyxidatus]|uniref:Uncharacterized protein n=1 Tax=Artomyces pyxidatus TaxID=48021 RepID=A0ACB8SNX1_9AGAM|nr:hypothetical protein BV25DRAFT_1811872 [Artomyces pyxidatus]
MGYTLPTPNNPAEHARALMARKDRIEADIEVQASILRANNTNMSEPLVDREGFPRADLDIWAVRHARVRIIELRNDLKDIMDEIKKALEVVYDPSAMVVSDDSAPPPEEVPPFAKVNGVAPGSPAADAGLLRDDLVLKFGELQHPQISLQHVASLVASHEDRMIRVVVQRPGTQGNVHLRLTPRQGWGGRGMLGCHLVPYTAS